VSSIQDLFDVRDARVVVTGAASGLGLAMAEVMAEAGARVTLGDLEPKRLETETARLAEGGGKVRSFQLDVSDREQVQALIDDVVGEQGGVDVLYANAGISLEPGITDPMGGIAAIETEAWERVLGVNLSGVVFSMGAAAEVMKRQGSGKIVVTASNAGLKVEPLVGYSYAATKAAVIHVVRQAAVELAPHGVNVNAIAPGPFRTRIGSGDFPDQRIERIWADLIPVGRMAETDELKGLALMLGSPAASFITGAVVLIDGGAMPSPFREETSLGG
jgi:NAD(P)-dependent dehydrogenase (short-subunit alcohol dehydrogenase family)